MRMFSLVALTLLGAFWGVISTIILSIGVGFNITPPPPPSLLHQLVKSIIFLPGELKSLTYSLVGIDMPLFPLGFLISAVYGAMILLLIREVLLRLKIKK